jgi:thioredoxin 1
MSAKLLTFTDQNWQNEVMAADRPVLVDFWAQWCKPCLAMVPDLEAVAELYADRLRVGKLNVEENGVVPQQYNITAMPTLLVLKSGKVVEQRVGKMSKDALVKLLEPLLK